MTKSQMHSYVSTSAKLALGLFLASNICLSTAWSDNCEDNCALSKDPSTRSMCMQMCHYSGAPGVDPEPRTGGCGIMPGGLIGRTQMGGSIPLDNRGHIAVAAPAAAPAARLSPEQTLKVVQIVNACLIVTKTDRTPTGIHVAEAQIRPGCQNYIRYSERGSVALGALNLGNEVLQMRITTRDGRDADQNKVEFAENGKITASYGRTDDSIENGLALLKAIF